MPFKRFRTGQKRGPSCLGLFSTTLAGHFLSGIGFSDGFIQPLEGETNEGSRIGNLSIIAVLGTLAILAPKDDHKK